MGRAFEARTRAAIVTSPHLDNLPRMAVAGEEVLVLAIKMADKERTHAAA